MCGNARRKGREVCPLPNLPKDKAERFIIDRIKNSILTEENLEELVRLTNEELAETCGEEREELQQAKADAGEALRCQAVGIADPRMVRHYVGDLRGLLERSSIVEQRSFLKSFVERIEVDDSEVKIYYTIPMPPSSMSGATVGVLPFVHHG